MMHVAVDAYLGLPLPSTSLEARLEAEQRLASFAAALGAGAGEAAILIESGDAAATIARIAAELPAQLIVIGTRAHIGLGELLLGSVAHRLMTCAPCPVVTLRGDEAAVSR
jgi:nucleotide-binding universal stress UspA family protein